MPAARRKSGASSKTGSSKGFNDTNSTMSFSTGREKGFTKTPANVKADYVHKRDQPNQAASSSSNKKRANDGSPKPKKQTAKSVPDNIASAAPIKRRKTGPKQAATRPIPRTYDECVAADKALIDMRDAGKGWTEIRAKWEELTGEKTGTSSLPNRYSRLKSNFTVIKEEDNSRLLEAKQEVEESFEAQKWELVAKVVGEKGGDTYPGVVLQRQYKKLMINGGTQPPAGIQDADFKGSEAGDEGEEDD